jgi:uncharacterized protein YdeI (YjbR/CyaY-like superfamily)
VPTTELLDTSCLRFDDDHRNLGHPHQTRKAAFAGRVHREKAEALIAAGRMAPAGLVAVESAQRDGRWGRAYGLSRHRGVPEDLQAALDGDPAAARFFADLDSRNRYAVLYRVQTAKTPETRARRIGEFVALLARGERIHPHKNDKLGPAA